MRWVVGAMVPGADPAPPDGPLPGEEIVRQSVRHGVERWVWERSRADGVRLPGVDSAVRSAMALHQRALGDLALVDRAFAAADIDFLVVKGPALVAQFYPGPGWRSYVDLDVLVRPVDVPRALSALEAQGATLLSANWPLLTRLAVHELSVGTPSGGVVDLHWSLAPRRGRRGAPPGAGTLFGRSTTIGIAGQDARTLDWADTVVHLAHHAAESGADRLVWLADLRAGLAYAPPDAAERLADRAAEWGAGPALHLMLDKAVRTLHLVPPAGLSAALDPGGPWSALVGLIQRTAPVSASPGDPGVARIIARSARSDGLGSLAALAGKSLQVLSPRPGWRPGLRDPWSDPGSGLHEAGTVAEREAFFAAITALAG